MIQLVLLSIEYESEKKTAPTWGRDGHFVVVWSFIVCFLFIVYLLPIRKYNGPRAVLANGTLEPLFSRGLECILRNTMRYREGEVLKSPCLVRHILAIRRSPSPALFLVLLNWLVHCRLDL